MTWTNRTITVFGGTGFIGRHLVHRLVRSGVSVRVASRHPSQAGFLRTVGEIGQVVPIAVDITDPGSVAAAVSGSDAVINLIGVLFETRRWSFHTVHGAAPGTIGAAAAAAGIERLIHISAIGADKESTSDYAITKAIGEEAIRGTYPGVTILRPSIIFGPEDGFFNMFARMAMLSPVLPLIGGGHTRFQPVYVGDVAGAIITALNSPATAGKTYELGGPRIYSFRAMIELMLAQMGRKRCLVSIPWGIARLEARLLELLPVPPLTRDQLELLKHDNVVAPGTPGLAELGVAPTAVEVILPTYLGTYRSGGPYAAPTA